MNSAVLIMDDNAPPDMARPFSGLWPCTISRLVVGIADQCDDRGRHFTGTTPIRGASRVNFLKLIRHPNQYFYISMGLITCLLGAKTPESMARPDCANMH